MPAEVPFSAGSVEVHAPLPVSAFANGNGMQPHQNNVTAKPGPVPSFAHTVLGAPYEPPLSPEDPDWALHVPATVVDAKDQGTADSWLVPASSFEAHVMRRVS